MAYYNYHARVMQKLKNGELRYYYFEPSYKNIGFALMLCFTDKKYPIRETHFDDYFELIGKYYITVKKGDTYNTQSIFDKNNK